MINFNQDLIFIAEIGVNHEGSLAKAIELTRLAHEAGADIIKFQSYTPERYVAAHDPVRRQRVTQFALSKEEHLKLYEFTKSIGATFMSTPVSEDWVDFLSPLCPAIKIASGDINFKPVIEAAAKTGKPLILSTGAATLEEIELAIKWVEHIVGSSCIQERLILMHCVSAYPVPVLQANILAIPFLKNRYHLTVGYSNHVIGMNACLAAVSHGANVVEVHFTDQKEGRDFRDHQLSFDPIDLRNFIHAAREIKQALGSFSKIVQPCESEGKSLLRKGIIAARDLKLGEVLSEDNLLFARPATEFSSNEIEDVIGKKIKHEIPKGFLVPRSSI